MKGTLHKTEQGWIVEYAKHSELPLHPEYVKYYFLDEDAEGGEVEFDIVDYGFAGKYAKLISPTLKPILTVTDIPTEKILEFVEDMKKGGMVDVPFEGKRMTFKHLTQEQADCLVKVFVFYETNRSQENAKTSTSKEQQKQLITEIMNEDVKNGLYDTVNDTVNKMAEEMYGKGKVPDYEEGFIDGYNKAQETLYTEEDIAKAVMFGRWGDTDKLAYMKFIQSVKQPKK